MKEYVCYGCYFFDEGDDDCSGNGTRPYCILGRGLWKKSCTFRIDKNDVLSISKHELIRIEKLVKIKQEELEYVATKRDNLIKKIHALETIYEGGYS